VTIQSTVHTVLCCSISVFHIGSQKHGMTEELYNNYLC